MSYYFCSNSQELVTSLAKHEVDLNQDYHCAAGYMHKISWVQFPDFMKDRLTSILTAESLSRSPSDREFLGVALMFSASGERYGYGEYKTFAIFEGESVLDFIKAKMTHLNRFGVLSIYCYVRSADPEWQIQQTGRRTKSARISEREY